MIHDIYNSFIEGLKNTTALEYIAVVAGILSVWFSKRENILVYPIGLINTVVYIYLSYKYHLVGEASVNLYYTVMSVYGWMIWARKDSHSQPVVPIQFSTRREWSIQLIFFAAIFIVYFLSLTFLKNIFFEGAIPWADSFATASAFTGMWLMAKKKVESWYWWIATNIASIPLYFVKGLVVTSVYYLVLLALAVAGLMAWKAKARSQNEENSYPRARINR